MPAKEQPAIDAAVGAYVRRLAGADRFREIAADELRVLLLLAVGADVGRLAADGELVSRADPHALMTAGRIGRANFYLAVERLRRRGMLERSGEKNARQYRLLIPDRASPRPGPEKGTPPAGQAERRGT